MAAIPFPLVARQLLVSVPRKSHYEAIRMQSGDGSTVGQAHAQLDRLMSVGYAAMVGQGRSVIYYGYPFPAVLPDPSTAT
jgi:hypothetical protein